MASPTRFRVVVSVIELEPVGETSPDRPLVSARTVAELAKWHVAELDAPADAITLGQQVRAYAERNLDRHQFPVRRLDW